MIDEKYEKLEQEHKDRLKEFFRERLRFTYYEIVKVTEGKCKQPSIFSIVSEEGDYLSSVKKCIIGYSSGLDKLAECSRKAVDLSFEAILYYNKDYQKLYEEDKDYKDLLEACEFALKKAYEKADRIEAEHLKDKSKKLAK